MNNFIDNIVKEVNNLRKNNKNKWYIYASKHNYNGTDLSIKIKGYNTWMQILEVNGIKHNSNMEISITEYKHNIAQALKHSL